MHMWMAGNASPAFAGAANFLHTVHQALTGLTLSVSQRSMLLSNVLETVTYIFIRWFCCSRWGMDGRMGRNLISVIPHWLEMEIH